MRRRVILCILFSIVLLSGCSGSKVNTDNVLSDNNKSVETGESAGEVYVDRSFRVKNMQEINQKNPHVLDYFGRSIAMSGDYVVVSHSGYNDDDVRVRSAYLYDVTDPSFERRIVANDLTDGDWYATDVAIDGDNIVIGALIQEGDVWKTAAYFYKVSDVDYVRKVVPTAIEGNTHSNSGAWFTHVDVLGDYVVFSGDSDEMKSGSVFMYKFSDLEYEVKIENPSPDKFDNFGSAVALSEDYLVIGAIGDDTNGEPIGSVYIYDLETLTFKRKIVPSNVGDQDNLLEREVFGKSVDVEGDYIIVGTGKHDKEVVYVFKVNDTDYERVIAPFDFGTKKGFGIEVILHEDTIIIGAPYDGEIMNNPGSIYLYSLSDINYEKKIDAFEQVDDSRFGHSIAYDGKKMVTAQSLFDLKGYSQENTLYVFEIK